MSSLKKLIPTSIVPRGKYAYTQEETMHTVTSEHFMQLVSNVIAHRKANNLPIPFNIEEEVEAQFCERRPELCEDTEAHLKPDLSTPQTLNSVVKLTRTLFKAKTRRVVQEVAEERASICATCEDNVQPKGCTGCNSGLMQKAIEFVVGAKKTPHDGQLKSCKHCGCFNAAQVWIPLDALQKTITESENENLPEHCWKKV
tara:strand:+ start:3623 stop:4222 length:600 start_codon:yes stop_codon:yes gene_type:complete